MSNKFNTKEGYKTTMTAGELNRHFPSMTVSESIDYPEEEFFVDKDIMYVFISSDTTKVGIYNDIESPSKVIDTTKKVRRIEIIRDN